MSVAVMLSNVISGLDVKYVCDFQVLVEVELYKQQFKSKSLNAHFFNMTDIQIFFSALTGFKVLYLPRLISHLQTQHV